MRSLIAVLAALALTGNAFAAPQLVPTKTLLVKNPPSGVRKVLWKVREPASAATVVGDPTADGATLRVVLTPGGDQCVSMPATGWAAGSWTPAPGASPDWSAVTWPGTSSASARSASRPSAARWLEGLPV